MTQEELFAQLEEIEETVLLELLELTSEDIVERFADRIAKHESRIRRALQAI